MVFVRLTGSTNRLCSSENKRPKNNNFKYQVLSLSFITSKTQEKFNKNFLIKSNNRKNIIIDFCRKNKVTRPGFEPRLQNRRSPILLQGLPQYFWVSRLYTNLPAEQMLVLSPALIIPLCSNDNTFARFKLFET